MARNSFFWPIIGLLTGAGIALAIPAESAEPPPVLNFKPACLSHEQIYFTANTKVLSPVKEILLTREAIKDGVEVYSHSSDTNSFGSIVLLYWQPKPGCVLFMEVISAQEYATRLGMSPIGISPFYKADDSTSEKK